MMAYYRDRTNRSLGSGFTIVELLVVIAIVAILSGLLLPALGAAREKARATRAHSDLRQMTVAIELYEQRYRHLPPTRENCMTDDIYPMPVELLDYQCTDALPEDVFSPGRTYRYLAPGPGLLNFITPKHFRIHVHEDFPKASGTLIYHRKDTSPIKCALWSAGPGGKRDISDVLSYRPMPPNHWYPERPDGLIVHYYFNNCWQSSP
jgi:prepilin-type N-terminal cleavage/methylation domain-containing protein